METNPKPSPKVPLPRPPEGMRPDRPEVMNAVGSGPTTEIGTGATFECLVGRHNQARRLTTGFATFSPGAGLPYHTHPFSESITLLAGSALVDVEGRSYMLGPRDNIVVPAERAHAVRNASGSEPTILHVAAATDVFTRTLVPEPALMRVMPADSQGVPGAERVNRFATAPRGAAGPNTEFIDYFNDSLMPGIEMSGGYGLFHPTGRLPAHVHDFDESICIISGWATCVVEGRHYRMSDCATALQPRGRVHYFINESAAPMEMLWVYAGPQPERIIVDEACATLEGDPWR
ncbi:MAG: cupin domain-containing protein [Isosphaeraceae bacterium]|nr:cupin domain-containing protein [Isosphaeraceae bacterium]